MSYQERHIEFKEVISINHWQVKVYTIVKNNHFDNDTLYQAVLKQLPAWLELENSFDARHSNHAFLILHAGNEGVFSVINWWVGGNMLNSHVFFSEHDELQSFRKVSGDGLTACIWELEVIEHERLAWTEHVLKKEEPDYTGYLESTFSRWV